MRSFDLVASLLGLVILSPVMFLVAVLVKLSSPGPVFYGQTRVGRAGRPFTLWKYRSMRPGADRLGSSVTAGRDRRITAAGRWLRRAKLDELPQLWNVLKGEMSFVGPRPEVPEIVAGYTPDMRRILDVRPGITGNASLHLRHEEDLLDLALDPDRAYNEIFVPAKVNLAMEHVKRRSWVYDGWILVRTLWAVTFGRFMPLGEHPVVARIREGINRLNAESGAAGR